MLKKFSISMVILAIFLVACSSSSTKVPTETSAEPIETAENTGVEGTAKPTLPLASPTSGTDQAVESSEANCTVVSHQPTPGPTEQSLVPPVGNGDWTYGPDDAAVTFIEYGDFQ
jgi:phosphohistidine phosphatase SixA